MNSSFEILIGNFKTNSGKLTNCKQLIIRYMSFGAFVEVNTVVFKSQKF